MPNPSRTSNRAPYRRPCAVTDGLLVDLGLITNLTTTMLPEMAAKLELNSRQAESVISCRRALSFKQLAIIYRELVEKPSSAGAPDPHKLMFRALSFLHPSVMRQLHSLLESRSHNPTLHVEGLFRRPLKARWPEFAKFLNGFIEPGQTKDKEVTKSAAAEAARAIGFSSMPELVSALKGNADFSIYNVLSMAEAEESRGMDQSALLELACFLSKDERALFLTLARLVRRGTKGVGASQINLDTNQFRSRRISRSTQL